LEWHDTWIDIRVPTTTQTGTWRVGLGVSPLTATKEGLQVGLEEMHLTPIRMGTTHTSRYRTGQNNPVITEPCVEGPPPSTDPAPLHVEGWDDSRVAVGGVAVKKSGKVYECWKWFQSAYQGAVLFDLRPLIDSSRPLPSKVELLFDIDNSGGFDWETLGHPPFTPCPRIWVFEALDAWQPGLFQVPNHPRGTVIGLPGHGEVHFKLPMTELVRPMIQNARGVSAEPGRHLGLLLNADRAQNSAVVRPGSSKCLSRYRNFVLEVTW
jgi:hypothetical protein